MTEIITNFISRIENCQSSENQYFPNGLFPAYRENPLIGYRRPDTTIFFSAIIAFTLQSIRDRLDEELKSKIDTICQRVIQNYPDFQNKDGLQTYNFWKTKPSQHFPNGHLFRHFDHFRIPDDVDDTAFVYMTSPRTQDECLWLKNKLAMHANGARQWIRNTHSEYRSLEAYSTWFGKNMYIEFDVSVLSNILYCIYQYDLPLSKHDEASMTYIRSVIETDRYIESPFRCAHQYPRTPLIIYHVTRLMASFNPPMLSSIRPKLIADTKKLLCQTGNAMDRVILSTSLMRLGEPTARIAVERYGANEFKGFYFFIAGLLTAYENKLLYKLAKTPLFHMHWVCEAHNWALLAEYEVLWQSTVENH